MGNCHRDRSQKEGTEDCRMAEGDWLCVLPYEIIVQILQQLPAKDIVHVALCCKTLKDITDIDGLWQHLCFRDYGVVSKEGWGSETSYQDLYTKILYKYGRFLGLWNYTKTPYGVLVHIKYEQGKIAGYNCLPPPSENVRGPIHCTMQLFHVVLKDYQSKVVCRQGHCGNLKMKERKLTFKCEECGSHTRHSGDSEFQGAVLQLLQTEFEEEDRNHLRLSHKFWDVTKSTRNWSKYKMSRVVLSPPVSVAPVRLGVYKGTYGAHGLELIHMTMADNGYQLLGNKLLGDPNVPSGETSLFIDLRCPMELTEDQQCDLVFLKQFKPQQLLSPHQVAPDASQLFSREAISFLRHDPEDLPNTCRARSCAENTEYYSARQSLNSNEYFSSTTWSGVGGGCPRPTVFMFLYALAPQERRISGVKLTTCHDVR